MFLRSFALCLIACVSLLDRASAAGAASPTPTPPKVGYLRFWNMLPKSAGTFELRTAGAPVTDRGLLPTAVNYRYSGYTEFPAARLALQVSKTGNPTVLKNLDINLKPDTYFTILVAPDNGTASIELINDTVDPTVTSGLVTVRNYFPDLTVSVAHGRQELVAALPTGKVFQQGGFSRSITGLTLRARLASGLMAESNAEVDFATARRATILVIPDIYGRFRPRVTLDGQSQ